MKTLSQRLLVFALLLTTACFAQQATKPLTNDDVTAMVKSSLPEEVILNAIQANDTGFDTSASGLIALKNAGVSAKVMDAMLASAAAKKNPPTPSGGTQTATGGGAALMGGANGSSANSASVGLAQFGEVVKAMMGAAHSGNGNGNLGSLISGLGATTTTSGGTGPVVAFLNGNDRKELSAERTFVAQTKSKSDSLQSIAVDSATKSALQSGIDQAWYATVTHLRNGIAGSVASDTMFQTSNDIAANIFARHFQPTFKYVWALSGISSPVVASSNLPKIDLNYASIPSINPDEFEPAIVKLTPSHSAWRLVGATKAKSETVLANVPQWQVYSSFIEDRVPSMVNKLASGHSQICPTSSLASGEYAVVLRPISKDKRFSGVGIAQNQGVGLLFNSAWSFSVK